MNSSTEDSPGIEQFLKTIKEIRSGVEMALKKTNKVIKKKWDAKKKPEVKQKSSNLVWIDAAHYNINQLSKKLLAK